MKKPLFFHEFQRLDNLNKTVREFSVKFMAAKIYVYDKWGWIYNFTFVHLDVEIYT